MPLDEYLPGGPKGPPDAAGHAKPVTQAPLTAEPAAPVGPSATAVDASALKSTAASFVTPKPDDRVDVPAWSCLDAALSYADRGWDVFPANLRGGGKKSYKSAEFSNGVPWGATKDPQQIKRDFAKWSSAGIGIPAGPENGIFDIECDTEKGHGKGVDGAAVLAKLEAEHSKLPETLMFVSPTGSLHRLFNWPDLPDGMIIKSCDAFTGEKGLDIIAAGGMFIAPPSKRGDGHYKWINNLPIADAPEWLLKLVVTPAAGQQKASNVMAGPWGSVTLPPRPSRPELFTAEYQAEIGNIHEDKPPIDSRPILKGCPFFSNAAITGGKDHPQGLWMQTALACTFMDRGREVFHGLSKGDARYDHENVDKMFDRKLAEREEKDIGYPACQTFENYGSTQCATCPHKGKIRSPLNLPVSTVDTSEQAPASDTQAPITTETTTTTTETSQILQAAEPFEIVCEPYTVDDDRSLPMWDHLYSKHLLRGTVSGTAAEGGGGKSTMSIVEALAMASGRPLLGVQVPYPMRVLLINFEDDRNTMKKRINAAMRHHKLTEADLGERLFVIARGELMFGEHKFQLGPKAGKLSKIFAGALMRFLINNEIDVASVDPFIRVHNEDESDEIAIKNVVEIFENIALQCDCAASLWSHTRKSNGNEVTVDSARGTRAFVDACRSIRMLAQMTAQEARTMNIEDRGPYFKTFNGKLNYAPKTDKCDWFKFESVVLLNGPEATYSRGDNVGVVTEWHIPVVTSLTPDQLAKIRSALAGGDGRDEARADMWAGKLIAPILGLDPVDDKVKLHQTINKLVRSGALERVSHNDRHRGKKMFIVPSGWLPPARDIEENR